MRSDITYCHKCARDRNKMNDGVYTCYGCGETAYGFVREYIPQIWMYKKSVHSRLKWFSRLARRYVDWEHVGPLTDDFSKVVGVMKDNVLIKGRNVSRYGYYLIRLAMRRGVELKGVVNDLKPNGKAIVAFDDRLFGKVYPVLGWTFHAPARLLSLSLPPLRGGKRAHEVSEEAC